MTREREDGARADHLKALDRPALERLVLDRADTDEEFARWLDTRLAALLPGEACTALDPAPYRRRAEALLRAPDSGRPRYRYRDAWDGGVDEEMLEALIGEAEPFLAAGRGADALAILKPVADVLTEYWPEYAHWDESLHEFFPLLDRLIAQAVLMDAMPLEAREALADELDGWQSDLAEHGLDDTFGIAVAACVRGWDETGLEEVLAGRAQDWPAQADDDFLQDGLTHARLAALDAMGRNEAYLNLSRAAGFHCDYAAKLAQSNRVDEAVAHAHARLSAPDEILRLAQAVDAASRSKAALDLAAWGLSLPANDEDEVYWRPKASRTTLARWLRDAAHEANRPEMMLTAARAAFEESLAQEDFRRAEKLAGPADWPDLRETLLDALLAAPYAPERLEILLEEDMIDEAVACVDPQDVRYLSARDETLARLAERAVADHPDWVIELSFNMAEPIMTEGQSTQYETAAGWLAIAGHAHAASGRSGQWAERLEGLIETHRRKYKLRPLLEALRP